MTPMSAYVPLLELTQRCSTAFPASRLANYVDEPKTTQKTAETKLINWKLLDADTWKLFNAD
jgi:hypothetical protein